MLTETKPESAQQASAGRRAIVIGSGFGGLAAAVRLGGRGFDVTVLEALDQPGGRARVFRDKGFVFDAGPTIITAPYLFHELWEIAGRRFEDDIELRPLDPFYRIRFDDGTHFDYCGDPERMRAEIAKFDPEAVEAHPRFLEMSAKIFKTAFDDLADHPFHRLSTMLGQTPALVRLGGLRSVYAKVGDFFRHPKLRIVFSFHPLLIGGNPLTTTSFYCLIGHLERKHGVHFCMGGTGKLVEGLQRCIETQGNRVRLNAPVARIETDGKRATGVTLQSGERIDADVVVSNADAATTYGTLLGHHRRRRWSDRKLKRSSYSMGLFVWYFGTDRRWDDVFHHTKVLGPRYEALLKDIFSKKHLAEDFSLYLHRPTATDPSLAPEGCDTFYALSPVPHLGGGVDWAAEAEPYRAKIEQRLEETVLPGLSKHIVTSRVMTPLEFRDELGSWQGAGFSLEPRLFQSAWFRPHNRSEELEGLYLVGAGTHPGAGVPGVISSAKVVEKVLAAEGVV